MSDPVITKPLLDPPNPNMACEPCLTQKYVKIFACSSCGGLDHQRKSSKKCPNYVSRVPKLKSNQIAAVENNISAVAVDESSALVIEKGTTSAHVTVLTTTEATTVPTTVTMATTNPIVIYENVNLSRPKFILLNNSIKYKPIVDVVDPFSKKERQNLN